MTYREIGENLGITEMGVHKCLVRAFDRLVPDEDAEHVRKMHLERLDGLIASWWDKAQTTIKAGEFLLRVLALRARIDGTDKLPPVFVHAEITTGQLEERVADQPTLVAALGIMEELGLIQPAKCLPIPGEVIDVNETELPVP